MQLIDSQNSIIVFPELTNGIRTTEMNDSTHSGGIYLNVDLLFAGTVSVKIAGINELDLN